MTSLMTSNVDINSKHIANSIESSLITLAKAIRVENKCTLEEAIESVRKFILKKHNELLSQEVKEEYKDVMKKMEIKIRYGSQNEEERKLIKILNYFI